MEKFAGILYYGIAYYTVDIKIKTVFSAYETGGMGVLSVEP